MAIMAQERNANVEKISAQIELRQYSLACKRSAAGILRKQLDDMLQQCSDLEVELSNLVDDLRTASWEGLD